MDGARRARLSPPWWSAVWWCGSRPRTPLVGPTVPGRRRSRATPRHDWIESAFPGTGTPAACWRCSCGWRTPAGSAAWRISGRAGPGRGLRGLTRVTGPALQGRAGDWRLTYRDTGMRHDDTLPSVETTMRFLAPVRAVRFGRVGGGRCRAGPAGGAYRGCPAATTGRRGTRPRCVRRSTTSSRPSPRRPNPARWVGSGPVGLGSGRWWMLAHFGGRRDAAAVRPGGAGHDVEQRNPWTRCATKSARSRASSSPSSAPSRAIEGSGALTAQRGRHRAHRPVRRPVPPPGCEPR